MLMIVLVSVFGLVTLVALACGVAVAATRLREEHSAWPPFMVAGVAFLIAGGSVLFGSMTTIGAKEVGVVTEFGKPTRVVTSGLNWVPFWSSVTKFDGTLQPLTLAGTEGDDKRVEVRIAGQGVAWLDVTLQWQIDVTDQAGVMELFTNYREPEKVDENYVERNLRAALVDVFADYDPIAGLSDPSVRVEPPTQRSGPALERLKTYLNIGGVKLVSLTISGIVYDDKTQNKINDFITVQAEKQLAQQRVEIAQLLAQANNELAAGARDPGTLYLRCLDLTERLIDAGKALPPGWSCSGSGVVVTTNAS